MKKTQTILYKTLHRALSLMRPHNTVGSLTFTAWLIDRLPDRLRVNAWQDAAGNVHIDNRTHDGHKTLFTAHVDTVHRTTGANKVRKTKSVWYADGAALGADDGVGCALLMHMIHAGVPGYYVFTQGEECGGIGAKHLAKEFPKLLGEFSRAVAFDRRGVDSVISHQGYGRCCSDAFAQALADALNDADDLFMYSPDDTGIYTDTAEFVGIIPECTNISCGYRHEHSDREQLDMAHFDRLAAAVLRVDWDALVTDRDPTAKESKDYGMGKDWWSTHVAHEYKDFLNEEEMLYECLLDAQQGFTKELIEMMAESAYPEDPKTAAKFINRDKLTEDTINTALDMCGKHDVDTILCTLFDMAYVD
jgi:hypothetical protein